MGPRQAPQPVEHHGEPSAEAVAALREATTERAEMNALCTQANQLAAKPCVLRSDSLRELLATFVAGKMAS